MEEQTTHPSVLAAETVPVPLVSRSAALEGEAQTAERKWLGLVFKVLVLALVVWLLKHAWYTR